MHASYESVERQVGRILSALKLLARAATARAVELLPEATQCPAVPYRALHVSFYHGGKSSMVFCAEMFKNLARDVRHSSLPATGDASPTFSKPLRCMQRAQRSTKKDNSLCKPRPCQASAAGTAYQGISQCLAAKRGAGSWTGARTPAQLNQTEWREQLRQQQRWHQRWKFQQRL